MMYLVISDKVHLHDIFPVDDSRNATLRVFYLDIAPEKEQNSLCICCLLYTGKEDHLLPISKFGKDNSCTARRTFSIVSYRLLFDLFLLEMTDGSSEF